MPLMKPDKQGVVAVLQDSTERYLVIRRGLTLLRAPGWWCFAGGEVEAGEEPPRAMEREVFEELGLRVATREKVHETISPNGIYLLHWFRVDLIGPAADLNPHPLEVAEVRWLRSDEILRLHPVLPGLIDWLKKRANAATRSPAC